MAQDVNQSETDVAALVRSALVARISQERFELWMPADCDWSWDVGTLTLSFPTDFARQIAKRVLHNDLQIAVKEVVGISAPIVLEIRRGALALPTASSGAADGLQDALAVQNPPGSNTLNASGCGKTSASTTASKSKTAAQALDESAMTANSQPEMLTSAESSDYALHSDAAETTVKNIPRATSSISRRRPLELKTDGNTKSTGGDQFQQSGHDGPPSIAMREFSNAERDENSAAALRSKIDHWSDFIPGTSSQLAWTTINLVANDPGRMTPALVHGPFGVGKSHMANALAQRLRSQRRQRRVLHITAEQFTNDFTEAIRGSGLPMLRRKYRDVDTLILDDLQFLLGKKATINELRHTLDNLLKGGRQVVFFADRPTSELEALGSDFVGRLRGGLVSPLLPLDEQTRFQILKRDLIAADVAVSDDIVLQIASRAIGDGRLLKGISKRLMAAAYMSDNKLTWDQCWNSIYDLIQGTQPIVRLGDIERVVCEVFGLEPHSLQSDRKTRSVSQPRMLAMFLARKYTPAAYQEIGDYFGQRRHSTVISAEKTVGSWLEGNTKLQLARGSLAIREAMRHVEAHLHVG